MANDKLLAEPALSRYGSLYQGPRIPGILTLVGVSVVLYLGREVFLPLAVALLLTFALAPIVSFLRKHSVPRPLAVLFPIMLSFGLIALLGFVLVSQVSNLARNIPVYQDNIVEKVRSLRDFNAGGGLIDQLTGAVERVGEEIETATQAAAAEQLAPREAPVPVEIITRQSAIDTLKNLIVPLVSPFATAGLVVVVVIFMLLEREQLRDRFIRLVGAGDIHRTTEALQDAERRVGHYLLMQLVVNTLYAVPITVGLWFLDIPNAVLWGLLTLIFRFVPYIGPAIGMLLPLCLALAIAPGWSLVLMTAALFLVMELISNNIIEPWLYGNGTGLSPLAIIVSAIFWTWLWGPLGLLLSTPLTVCLVVLGRYVPQFEFLDVMLGNDPVLEPQARLYQRLLANDPDEATDTAETFLRTNYLIEYYDGTGIPALLLAEQDRERGVLSADQMTRVCEAALALVDNLDAIAREEAHEEEPEATPEVEGAAEIVLPDGAGHTLAFIGGRGALDDAAAAMLAQVFQIQSAAIRLFTHAELRPDMVDKLALEGVDTVVIAYLGRRSAVHGRYMVRRLKRLDPRLRVGLFLPGQAAMPAADALPDSGADFVAYSVLELVREGLASKPPVPLRLVPKDSGRLKFRYASR